jgi:hypothetical protein
MRSFREGVSPCARALAYSLKLYYTVCEDDHLDLAKMKTTSSAAVKRHVFPGEQGRGTAWFYWQGSFDQQEILRQVAFEHRRWPGLSDDCSSGYPAFIYSHIFPAGHEWLAFLSLHLKQLEALHLIERRLPATVPPEQRRTNRNSRYHPADSYLRFYFRFIQPNLSLVGQELAGVLWQRIAEQIRAFVGLAAFEKLCRELTLVQARAGRLPFPPEIVGSHWSSDRSSRQEVQVNVVVLNWREQAIWVAEYKWGAKAMGHSVVQELVEKAPHVVSEEGWHVHYAFFARAGAGVVKVSLVDLERLDADLRWALEKA